MRALGLGLGINKLGSLGSKFIAKFGTGLSAAYFLAGLGSQRGTVDSATNPVSRDRRDGDLTLRSFTAQQRGSGEMLTWATETNTFYTSDFSDGNDGWSGSGAVIFSNVDADADGEGQPPSDNWLKLSATTRLAIGGNNAVKDAVIALGGGDYRVTVDYYAPVDITDHRLRLFLATLGDLTSSMVNFSAGFGTATYNITISTSEASDLNVFWIGGNNSYPASTLLYLKNIRISKLSGNGLIAKWYDGLSSANDATQATVADMPKTVVNGALVVDGNGNASTLWDGTDEFTFTAAFTGLTSANVYAVTDNAGTVTLDTITAFDISGITTMTALLTSLTYTKVTAVIIAPDNANQAAIQADLNRLFGI